MTDKGWQQRFEDPISLPNGKQLVTLEDAGNYITKLPKAEHMAVPRTSLFWLPLLRTYGGSQHWWPDRHLLRFCASRSVGVA